LYTRLKLLCSDSDRYSEAAVLGSDELEMPGGTVETVEEEPMDLPELTPEPEDSDSEDEDGDDVGSVPYGE
jgi:hypothetical protein